MNLLHDLEPLLPGDERTAAERDLFVAELERSGPADRTAPAAAGPRRAHPATAQRRPRPAAVRRRPLLVAAAAFGLAAAVVVPRLGAPDVVSEARAAMVVPRGGVLHLKVRYEIGTQSSLGAAYDGAPEGGGKIVGRYNGVSERWMADDPWRERQVDYLDAPGGGTETVQTVDTTTDWRVRTSWEDETEVHRLTPAEQRRKAQERRTGESQLESAANGLSEDPVAYIQRLLASGQLRSDGSEEVDGRDARRLVGTARGLRGDDGTWYPGVELTYLVDASTYAPLRVRSLLAIPARPAATNPDERRARRIEERWVFETFERLPLNAATAKLLTIDPGNAGATP